jgi:hypothetical protein
VISADEQIDPVALTWSLRWRARSRHSLAGDYLGEAASLFGVEREGETSRPTSDWVVFMSEKGRHVGHLTALTFDLP